MKRTLLSTAGAIVCAGVLAGAQSPAPTTAPTPRPQPGAEAQSSQAAMTMTGCVYSEKDVPGRAPNIAERAGVFEDFILADIRMGGTSGATGAGTERPGTTGTSGATADRPAGTTGTSRTMYKLEDVDDDKLEALVGKRVEVTGRVDDAAASTTRGATADRPAGQTDRGATQARAELPEFEVASIREIAGTCAATPATSSPGSTPTPAPTPTPTPSPTPTPTPDR